MNELFSGLLTNAQQQQQPMRINQMTYNDAYTNSNLIDQSSIRHIHSIGWNRPWIFFCLVRHRQMQIRLAAANITNPPGKNANARFNQ